MKHLFIILFLLVLSPQNVFSQNNTLQVSNVIKSSLTPSKTTMDYGYSLGFEYPYNFGFNRYISFNDFNNDGKFDILIPVGSYINNTTHIALISLFIQKEDFVFEEDPNYLMMTDAGSNNYTTTVGDINKDGLLDVYLMGYYGNGNTNPSSLFINNGSSFDKIILNGSNINENKRLGIDSSYTEKQEGLFIDINGDTHLDFIIPHVPCSVYPSNHVLKIYTLTDDSKLNVDLLLKHPFNENDNCAYWNLDPSYIKVYDDKLYLIFTLMGEHTGDEFNKHMLCNYSYPITSFENETLGCVELKRNPNLLQQKAISDEWTFYIEDINVDGEPEFFVEMWSDGSNSIHIFDLDGNEITQNIFIGNDYRDKQNNAANGYFLEDINNDGYKDIVTENSFIEDKIKYIFLNNGNNLIKTQIISDNNINFSHLIDVNSDGYYEIFNIPNLQYGGILEKGDIFDIEIVFLDYESLNTSTEHFNSISFDLNQNYPNPFNPITTISYQLKFNSFVNLFVTDITGRVVKTLVNDYQVKGKHHIEFDANNLPSGVYFYSINTNNLTQTKSMTLIK